MRGWCSRGIRARRERNSEIVAPMVVPWPQVVSRTGITDLVAARDAVRAVAMRERDDSRVEALVAPGLGRGFVSHFYSSLIGVSSPNKVCRR